ncbi:ROK family protein [Aquibacillus saliphilus]|uniref:ROK family protein n=1 Tax=Aquibacillus saliphilus TaxID=1909422 RepID=UPI001CF0AD8C|nr:ROK family protein [Aquibacillus saliphilus]
MKKYIAIDVGGTNVKHAVILEDGSFVTKNKYRTDRTNLNRFVEDMIQIIDVYIKQYEISGIGISMPGFINVETGYSETAGSITVLNDKNLRLYLEERITLPIEMENDGNCVALAEKLNGNAVDCENFICVTVGTGIGGGIVINNKIVHGHSYKGGEFGFMVTQNGITDKELWHFNGSTGSLIKDYKKLKSINESVIVEGERIFAEAEQDENVQELINYWLRNISNGIFNLVATLNPQKILIGGGVSAREDLLDRLKSHLNQNQSWNDLAVPIEICKHKNDAGMLGALKHFLDRNGRA